MKRIIFYFSLILIITSCGKKDDFVGEWQSQEQGDNTSFIFKEDKTLIIIRNGKEESFENMEQSAFSNGKVDEYKKGTYLTYQLDNSKKPKWIDIIVHQKESEKEVGKLNGIFEVLSPDNIKLSLTSSNRPKEFGNQNDGNLIIKRTK